MKITKLITFTAFIFFLFMLKLSLSSSSGSKKLPGPGGPSYCETFDHATDYSSNINIDFRLNGGYQDIPYRYSGWDNFYPYHDLRSGYTHPETSLSTELDSYFCTIEVTTPDCSDWEWSTIMPNPTNGNGNITIKLPDESYYWDVRVDIRYYEMCSDGTYSSYNSLVYYEYKTNTRTDELYFGSTTYFKLYPIDEYNCYELKNKDYRVEEILEEMYQQ